MSILAKGYRAGSLQEHRAERMQGYVRITAALIMAVYAVVASLLVTDPAHVEPWAQRLVVSYAVYLVIGFALLAIIRRHRGHYPVRRVFAMLCDYAAAAFSIIAGCTVMLPFYVYIVFIALGNGLRYGRQYLITASALAQLCLAIIILTTPHWRADPTMIATLAITALVVPVFAYALLREKERAEQATQAAIEAKSRFLAQASHDLRQPIHAMTLFLSSLKQTPLTSEQDVLVTRLDRSLDGMSALFRSLLDISSIDGGALSAQPARIPVQQLFGELQQHFGTSPDGTKPSIRFVPTKLWIRTDPVLIGAMLQNIIANAVRHGKGADILVGCRRRGGRVSILVCDRGPGIAVDHLPYLFEEFYQVRKAPQSERDGVGLGLAIVQRLADMLNIRPDIASQLGKGTVVSLHGIERAEPLQPAEKEASQRVHHGTPLLDMRVLLVEDDRDMLGMTADLLRSWGCEIQAFDDLPEAPDPCDLVVTDYDLGRMENGLDVIRGARAASGREVPAIIVTGHDEGTIARQLAGKGHIVLQKPVRPAELRSAISTLRLKLLR